MGRKSPDVNSRHPRKLWVCYMLNNNLEQQAQALFKKWFIDNPENVDWSAGTFRELIQSTLNGDWGKETPTGNNTEKVYCIRGADIPEVKCQQDISFPRTLLIRNLKQEILWSKFLVEVLLNPPEGAPQLHSHCLTDTTAVWFAQTSAKQ